jgi:hypothetical protein
VEIITEAEYQVLLTLQTPSNVLDAHRSDDGEIVLPDVMENYWTFPALENIRAAHRNAQ